MLQKAMEADKGQSALRSFGSQSHLPQGSRIREAPLPPPPPATAGGGDALLQRSPAAAVSVRPSALRPRLSPSRPSFQPTGGIRHDVWRKCAFIGFRANHTTSRATPSRVKWLAQPLQAREVLLQRHRREPSGLVVLPERLEDLALCSQIRADEHDIVSGLHRPHSRLPDGTELS